MGLSVRNDIASIIQCGSKIAIVPHIETVKIEPFDECELAAMLALYSSYYREKVVKMIDKNGCMNCINAHKRTPYDLQCNGNAGFPFECAAVADDRIRYKKHYDICDKYTRKN